MSIPSKTNLFLRLLQISRSHSVPILMDGAIGTMLDDMGFISPNAPWSGLLPLEHPSALFNLHQEYIQAGAQIITTCTFRASPRMFAQYKQKNNRWKTAINKAVQIAYAASKGRVVVAGSVGPIDDCFTPSSSMTAEEAERCHLPAATELIKAKVDVLWFETFGHVNEIAGALRLASKLKKKSGVPFVLSVTTLKSGQLLDGASLAKVIPLVEKSGASAFMVNCIPFFHVEPVFEELLTCSLPLGIYANLGIPEKNQDWSSSAHLTPQAYANLALKWQRRGIQLLGACCGSSPEHIAALSAAIARSDPPCCP